MSVSTKCFVEIFCLKNEVLAFDLGFAGIIIYPIKKYQDDISVYLEDKYATEFTKFWHCRALSQANQINSVETSSQFFDDAAKILLKMPLEQKNFNILCGLLRKNFLRHFKLYGR